MLKFIRIPRSVKDDTLEVDLNTLIELFSLNKRLIVYSILIFLVLGIFYILASPTEYKANIEMISEQGKSQGDVSSSLLRQFTGIGGIDRNESSSVLSPEFYPRVIQSTPFLLELRDKKINLVDMDSAVTIKHYYDKIMTKPFIDIIKNYTLYLPVRIKNWIIGPNKLRNLPLTVQKDTLGNDINKILKKPILKLSRGEMSDLSDLKSRISIASNNSVITTSVIMPDPIAAAELTEHVADQLTLYLSNYRTEKLKQNYEFILEQYGKAKTRYENSQRELAEFRDRNRNIVTAEAKIEEQILTNEFNIAFNLYNTLAQQLEQAKIKIEEERPFFTVLEPVQIPIEKSEPNEKMIIVGFIFLGLFLSVFIIFLKYIISLLPFFKKKLKVRL